jgi:hypothetical protein
MIPEQQSLEETRRNRRRQVRREIVLPVAGGFILLLGVVLIAWRLPTPQHTAFVSNLLLTLLILCPAVICLFPVYLLLVFAIYGMGRANQSIYRPLSRLEALTHRMSARTDAAAEQIAQRTIGLSSRFARLEHIVLKLAETGSRPGEKDET